ETVNMGLWYTKDSGFEPTGFSDADYVGCKDTFKSTSGESLWDTENSHVVINDFSNTLTEFSNGFMATRDNTKTRPTIVSYGVIRRLRLGIHVPRPTSQNRRDLPRNFPLDRVEVLEHQSDTLRIHSEDGNPS
ncbi:hypothetical protein Tco_0864191, partial [Tanacetum coccineum]